MKTCQRVYSVTSMRNCTLQTMHCRTQKRTLQITFCFCFFGTNGNFHCKAKKATRGQYPCVSLMEVHGIKVARVTVSTKITHFGHRKTPQNLFVVSIAYDKPGTPRFLKLLEKHVVTSTDPQNIPKDFMPCNMTIIYHMVTIGPYV